MMATGGYSTDGPGRLVDTANTSVPVERHPRRLPDFAGRSDRRRPRHRRSTGRPRPAATVARRRRDANPDPRKDPQEARGDPPRGTAAERPRLRTSGYRNRRRGRSDPQAGRRAQVPRPAHRHPRIGDPVGGGDRRHRLALRGARGRARGPLRTRRRNQRALPGKRVRHGAGAATAANHLRGRRHHRTDRGHRRANSDRRQRLHPAGIHRWTARSRGGRPRQHGNPRARTDPVQ